MGPVIADMADELAAESVAAQASERASRSDATVVVCVDGRSRRTSRRVERALARLRRTPRVEYLSGAPAEARARLIRRCGASLLVTAPGLTALMLMRTVPTPVLLARPALGEGPILGATDFADPRFPALSAAVTEAAQLGLPLALCHVVDEQTRIRLAERGLPHARDEVKGQLERFARSRGVRARLLISAGDPTIELVRLTAEVDASLLVVARRHSLRALGRFVPTTGDLLVVSVRCPVLSVPKES